MTTKKKRKELIRWIDSQSICDRWTPIDELDHAVSIVETLGWVVHENKETVSVVASVDWAIESCVQGMIIPKVSIKSRRVL